MKKKYIISAIVAGCILIFFWSRFTFGFEEPLTPVATTAIIFYVAFAIMLFAFSLSIGRNKRLQKFIDEVDIDELQKTEEKYHRAVKENDELKKELITVRGNVLLSGHDELLPEKAKKKSTTKKKATKKETPKKEVPKKETAKKPDSGMIRANKERLAYRLKCEGKSRQEIADAIGLSVGSVSRYVSRGKQAAEGKK